ncbi:hypothetical protein GCM10010423_11560 [Streptomyces levis]|uniref:Uncharacterized protein n=1 Tax=Streptomyces levis TaxID=285566 RepID=A0ABP6AQK1_9ACTN
MPVPIVPRPTTATVRSGDRDGSERGVAIAGLQDEGGDDGERVPGAPGRAGEGRIPGRTGRVRSAGVVRAAMRTRPVPSLAGVHTPGANGRSDRPCPGAGSYCGA